MSVGNKGNRRTGAAKGERTHTGRFPGAMPWRQDVEILERMAKGWQMRMAGHTVPEIALALGVSEGTVKVDRVNLLALRKEEAVAALDQHLEALEGLIRENWAEFQKTKNPKLLAEMRALVMDKARLDGSLKEQVEHGGEVSFTFDIPKPEGMKEA